MLKPKLPRVTEPDENMVHYQPADMNGNVMLCSLTDFICHANTGEGTMTPVSCNACKSIKEWCDKHSAQTKTNLGRCAQRVWFQRHH